MKLRWGRVTVLAGLAIYGVLSVGNMFFAQPFETVANDYALYAPDRYDRVVLESEDCSVLDKLTATRLRKQKEAARLAVRETSIPEVTLKRLDNGSTYDPVDKAYIVGDVTEGVETQLESLGIRVYTYNGIIGFLKTII